MTDVLHRTPHAPGHLFQDLWVRVDGLQNPRDDLPNIVELDLERGLGLDPLDGETDTAEPDIRPYLQFEQVQHFGLEGDGGSEVFDFELDLVDLHHRHVEEHVRLLVLGLTTAAFATWPRHLLRTPGPLHLCGAGLGGLFDRGVLFRGFLSATSG